MCQIRSRRSSLISLQQSGYRQHYRRQYVIRVKSDRGKERACILSVVVWDEENRADNKNARENTDDNPARLSSAQLLK